MSTGYKIDDQSGLYFVTFTVVGWADLFTREIYRRIVADSFNYCTKQKGLCVWTYVFMSNHIHCILSADKDNLSAIIRDMKSHTSREIYAQIQKGPESRMEWLNLVCAYAAGGHNRNEKYQVWQHDNHAEELFSEKFIQQKLHYTHMNPVRVGWVRQPQDWIWSSALDYAEGIVSGPINISFLQNRRSEYPQATP